MKIILTGSTGFIGSQILRDCLANDSIKDIVVLSRRPLTESTACKGIDATSSKLHVVLVQDFTAYSPEIMKQLAGAEACIIDYTNAALSAWNSVLKGPDGRPFRFIYMSGALAERDQNSKLWFADEMRKLRGEVENNVVAAQNADMSTFVARPQLVLNSGIAAAAIGPFGIKTSHLSASCISFALKGADTQIWENGPMKELGAKLS